MVAKRAAQRVRHLHKMSTQLSMLKYLRNYRLFEEMKNKYCTTRSPVSRKREDLKITIPLRVPAPSTRRELGQGMVPLQMHIPNKAFTDTGFQSTFLHRQARVARVELLDMLCEKFGLRQNLASYRLLERLHYTFGQKLTRDNGQTYWGTDTGYHFDTSYNCRRRRDILRINIKQEDKSTAAFCAQTVLFLTVYNVHSVIVDTSSLSDTLKEELYSQIVKDSLTFVLVRWFEPHHESFQRDSDNLPMCPGALYINHCLWTYASTPSDRKLLVVGGDPTPYFRRQAVLFGDHIADQMSCLEKEKKAYYGLVYPNNIVGTTNMHPGFVPGTATPDPTVWLQSVTLV